MTLEIQYRQTAKLVPYARNGRTHSDEQVAQVSLGIDWHCVSASLDRVLMRP